MVTPPSWVMSSVKVGRPGSRFPPAARAQPGRMTALALERAPAAMTAGRRMESEAVRPPLGLHVGPLEVRPLLGLHVGPLEVRPLLGLHVGPLEVRPPPGL